MATKIEIDITDYEINHGPQPAWARIMGILYSRS